MRAERHVEIAIRQQQPWPIHLQSVVESDAATNAAVASARHAAVNHNRAAKLFLSAGDVERVQPLNVRCAFLGFGDTVESSGGAINNRCADGADELIDAFARIGNRHWRSEVHLPERRRRGWIVGVEGVHIVFHRGDVHHVVNTLANVHAGDI